MKKYKVLMGVALIIVACFLFVYLFIGKKKEPVDRKKAEKQIEQQEEEKKNQEDEKKEEKKEIVEERIEPDLADKYYVSDNFELLGLPEGIIEEAQLKEAIQTYMYLNGYAGFDNAKYVGSQDIPYLGQMIMTIDIGAKNEFRLQAIFDEEKKVWKIVTW